VRTPAPSPQEEEKTGDGALLECGSAGDCVLLTNFGSDGGTENEEAGDIFDGASWQELALPPGILFQALSCPVAGECVALGGPRFDGPVSAYRFERGVWSAPEPLPISAGGEPVSWYALTCLTAGECWAAGGQPIAGATFPAVVVHLHDGEWRLPPQPEDPGEFTGVACSSVASCLVVGGASVSTTSAAVEPLAMGLR
jgi:hypothetical protein